MQFALLIYERPHDFDRRQDPAEQTTYTGAWQAWHKALLQAGVLRQHQRAARRVHDSRVAVARCGPGVGGALPGRLIRCRGSATDRRRSSQACDG